MNQDPSNRALNKQTPPTDSTKPAESAAFANAVRADSAPSSVLSINGGSSSIRFAVYEKGESPRLLLEGKVDRVGRSGTNLTFTDATGEPQDRRAIESEDPEATVAFLLDWLEAQPVFASVNAVGHRVVHGMTHTEPERITPELLDELRRIMEMGMFRVVAVSKPQPA